jgi:hypothetical protein
LPERFTYTTATTNKRMGGEKPLPTSHYSNYIFLKARTDVRDLSNFGACLWK